MGLAYAVTRDIGSYLRYETHDDAGNPNPLALSSSSTGIRRAYSSGTSSTGMYQREFLYWASTRMSRPASLRCRDHLLRRHAPAVRQCAVRPSDILLRAGPASGLYLELDRTLHLRVTTDPISGIRDGILKRPGTDPLVMQIDEELVFWQWKASLNVINALGRRVPVPITCASTCRTAWGNRSVRSARPPQPAGICQNPTQGAASR